MSKVCVSSFDENGIIKYGLFISDGGVLEPYKEDWKPVVYDIEDEAVAKLKSLEAEKEREDSAVSFSFEDAEKYVESHKWKYASTYAKTAPHEYLVKRWLSDDEKSGFERLVQTINEKYVVGYFYGHKNRYLILGDKYYWYMDCYPDNMAVDLINRAEIDYLEFRDGCYFYKPKQ